MLAATALSGRRALAAALVLFLAVLAPTAANAGDKGKGGGDTTQAGATIGGNTLSGQVTTTTTTTGSHGTTGTPSSALTSGGESHCHDSSGAVIPCSMTVWGQDYTASDKCGGSYAAVVATTAAGSLYSCDPTACTAAMIANPQTASCGWFVPTGGVAAPPVDPVVLARTALKRMKLPAPSIHMAPQPPLKTYVGLSTWLWIDQGQFSTMKLTVSLRDTTVTVTAVPTGVAWNLTDGSTTCADAGRVWSPGLPKSATTDCSYTFSHVSDFQPNKQFPVSAAISFDASWTCTGRCTTTGGDLGAVTGPTANSAIRVGEIQTVNN